jgi:hypothetical protein
MRNRKYIIPQPKIPKILYLACHEENHDMKVKGNTSNSGGSWIIFSAPTGAGLLSHVCKTRMPANTPSRGVTGNIKLLRATHNYI